VDTESPHPLVLPCHGCRQHWTVAYKRADFSEENIWLCPECGEPNRLRLRGRLTTVEPSQHGK